MIGPSRHNSHVWLLLAERTDSKDTNDSDYSSLSDDISNTTSYTFRIPVSISLSLFNRKLSKVFPLFNSRRLALLF